MTENNKEIYYLERVELINSYDDFEAAQSDLDGFRIAVGNDADVAYQLTPPTPGFVETFDTALTDAICACDGRIQPYDKIKEYLEANFTIIRKRI